MAGFFELYHDRRGAFRYRLKQRSGEIILASDGYDQRASALDDIDSVRRNALADARYEYRQTGAGEHMFILTARNGRVIGASESFRTAYGRDYGIDRVKQTAPGAPLVDATD